MELHDGQRRHSQEHKLHTANIQNQKNKNGKQTYVVEGDGFLLPSDSRRDGGRRMIRTGLHRRLSSHRAVTLVEHQRRLRSERQFLRWRQKSCIRKLTVSNTGNAFPVASTRPFTLASASRTSAGRRHFQSFCGRKHFQETVAEQGRRSRSTLRA